MNFLDQLKNRSEATRRKIAGISALVLTALVFIIWIASLGNSFAEKAKENENNGEALSPFAMLGESAENLFDSIAEIFNKQKEVIDEIKDASAGISGELNPEPVVSPAQNSINGELPEDINELGEYFEVIGEESPAEGEAEVETEAVVEENNL